LFTPQVSREPLASGEPAAITDTAQPVLRAPPLPDKPSIAVLPFENMSGDAGQEYFVDGMVEEIITVLSRIRWLFVIAQRKSSLTPFLPRALRKRATTCGSRSSCSSRLLHRTRSRNAYLVSSASPRSR
jgi:hypothetical protein